MMKSNQYYILIALVVLLSGCFNRTGYDTQSKIELNLKNIFPKSSDMTAINSSIVLSFNTSINAQSVNSDSIRIIAEDGEQLETIYEIFKNIIIISPKPGFFFDENTYYSIHIYNIINTYGNSLSIQNAGSFLTGSQIDNTPPGFLSAEAEEKLNSLTLFFDEPIQYWNITNNTFELYDIFDDTTILLNLTDETGLEQLHFEAQTPLNHAHKYRLVVNNCSNIQDMAGNIYNGQVQLCEIFPEAYHDNESPSISFIRLVLSQASGGEWFWRIAIFFSEPMIQQPGEMPIYINCDNTVQHVDYYKPGGIEPSWADKNEYSLQIKTLNPVIQSIYLPKQNFYDESGNQLMHYIENLNTFNDYIEGVGEVVGYQIQ